MLKGMFRGTEIRKLVAVSMACCLVLVAAVSLFLILSSRSALRRQTDRMKTAMAEQIINNLQTAYFTMSDYLKASEGIEFGSSVMEMFMRDSDLAYGFFCDSLVNCYNADFAVFFSGGSVKKTSLRPGATIPEEARPGIAGGGEYAVLDRLGGREGTFIVIEKPGMLTGETVIYAIDSTEQINAIRSAFDDEKSRAVRNQVIGVALLFIALLALSLAAVYLAIKRLLDDPIKRLSAAARRVARNEEVAAEEVREDSIFANLQRLINSGRVICGKAGIGEVGEEAGGDRFRRREIRKVLWAWGAAITVIFLAASALLLASSVSLMNSKAQAILDRVSWQMADYYSLCYDSIKSYTLSNPSIYVGRALWDPSEREMDREATIKRLIDLVVAVFDCDAAVSHLEPEGRDPEYLISYNPRRGEVDLGELPERMGEPVSINRGFYREGDLVLILMSPSDYPYMGRNQFAFYVVDITDQAEVLEGLYDSGSSSLLRSQLLISLLFLALSLLVASLSIALATRRYVTLPILELDELSGRVMEGETDLDIRVDEGSSFADMQRLLKRAQELLRSMEEEV